jgi:hypothetical protein
MHLVPVGAIVGTEHLVKENASSDTIDRIQLLHCHLDICI